MNPGSQYVRAARPVRARQLIRATAATGPDYVIFLYVTNCRAKWTLALQQRDYRLQMVALGRDAEFLAARRRADPFGPRP